MARILIPARPCRRRTPRGGLACRRVDPVAPHDLRLLGSNIGDSASTSNPPVGVDLPLERLGSSADRSWSRVPVGGPGLARRSNIGARRRDPLAGSGRVDRAQLQVGKNDIEAFHPLAVGGEPAPMRSRTIRVTSRYIRLNTPTPSASASPAWIDPSRSMTSATESADDTALEEAGVSVGTASR
jgi:hypothetical protein